MRMTVGLGLSLGLVLTQATPVRAAEESSTRLCPICHRANDPHTRYAEQAGATLVRGATNALFGWTELLLQSREEVEKSGNPFVGVGKGVSAAGRRTVLGFGELLTFWVLKGKHGSPPMITDCPICMSATQQSKRPHPQGAPKTPTP